MRHSDGLAMTGVAEADESCAEAAGPRVPNGATTNAITIIAMKTALAALSDVGTETIADFPFLAPGDRRRLPALVATLCGAILIGGP
jgi:hypothetical protein